MILPDQYLSPNIPLKIPGNIDLLVSDPEALVSESAHFHIQQQFKILLEKYLGEIIARSLRYLLRELRQVIAKHSAF